MTLDRRDFLGLAAAGAAWPALSRLGRGSAPKASSRSGRDERPPSAQESARAAELYEEAIVIDSLAVGHEWDEVEFAAVEASGYTAIQTTLPSNTYEVADRALRTWNARCEEHADRLLRVERAADIERAEREGRMGVMFGFQNATMIHRDLDNLDRLYALGTRCIQLTYNDRNLLGNGCTERVDGGLSDFGVAAVKRMNELGIVVDLSHCGYRTTMDGIAFSAPPACFTHTMCEALYPGHPRAKTDEQIRTMARNGGVMGVAALGYFVGPDPGGATTIEHYLDHIEHAVAVGGIDHVGLCTDFQIRGIASWATRENWYEPRLRNFKPSYQVRWPPWIPELDDTDRFRRVTAGLMARGYSDEEVLKVLGGNWLRYFRDVIG
ncbi:MAG: membrane dipeptidase [Gemmatimonadota bacterium]|nr:membrane dipeptidase [Gemmatimonadota bacterium]